MKEQITLLMHLIQYSDSAFPVGTFSFSNGLETAATHQIVHDAATLEQYTLDLVRQTVWSDGIAALEAFRAYHRSDYEHIVEADRHVIHCKMNTEARRMTRRMGKKLAELSTHIFPDETIALWLEDCKARRSEGSYPVAQALVFAASNLKEEELFASMIYGVANMILSAALRCVRVSHFDTQRILHRIASEVAPLYEKTRNLDLNSMSCFTPQADILASLHEKGLQRMFMN